MIIIEEFGRQDTGLLDNRTNKPVFRLMAIFECEYCKIRITLRRDKGLIQKSCTKCKSKQNISHGLAYTRQYTTWAGMIQRCENPKATKYQLYGGRGITVCDKWKTFEGFWEDNKDSYSDELSIDRIDSSKGYNKENVRWISSAQNSSETTKRRPVTQYRIALQPEKHLVEVKQWESAKCAADSLGLVSAHITTVCSGKRSTHGGFAWKYTN